MLCSSQVKDDAGKKSNVSSEPRMASLLNKLLGGRYHRLRFMLIVTAVVEVYDVVRLQKSCVCAVSTLFMAPAT
jgi:hypothetical protein